MKNNGKMTPQEEAIYNAGKEIGYTKGLRDGLKTAIIFTIGMTIICLIFLK